MTFPHVKPLPFPAAMAATQDIKQRAASIVVAARRIVDYPGATFANPVEQFLQIVLLEMEVESAKEAIRRAWFNGSEGSHP
jgi:hypothetical protein